MSGSNDKQQILHPTLYSDVNSVLDHFLKNIKRILKDNFVGMYLYGSLALGDFHRNTSDIDFIVVTNFTISENVFKALSELHEDFKKSKSFWADKIEAAYIVKHAMNNKYPTNEKYPVLCEFLNFRQRQAIETNLSNVFSIYNRLS